MITLSSIFARLKSMTPGAKAQRLALAEAEMIKAISILAAQHEQMERAVNEIVDALNRFGIIVGLEWNSNHQKWTKLQ